MELIVEHEGAKSKRVRLVQWTRANGLAGHRYRHKVKIGGTVYLVQAKVMELWPSTKGVFGGSMEDCKKHKDL